MRHGSIDTMRDSAGWLGIRHVCARSMRTVAALTAAALMAGCPSAETSTEEDGGSASDGAAEADEASGADASGDAEPSGDGDLAEALTDTVAVADISLADLDGNAEVATVADPGGPLPDTSGDIDESSDSGATDGEGSPCAPEPCVNGGTCTDLVDGFDCDCAPGWDGDTCQLNIDDCDPNPCANEGACSDLVNGFSCDCAPGWEGDTC